MKNYFYIFFVLFTIFSTQLVYAQDTYFFKLISKQNGLSSNTINSITEDKHGFIWIATDDGLNRFDGQKVTTFFNNPEDTSTISSNIVDLIYTDRKGRFWVGTFDKLHLYDEKKEAFIDVAHNQAPEIKNKVKHVHTMAEDKDGWLWLGTRDGLYKLYINEQNEITITDQTHIIKRFQNDNGNYVRKIIIDKDDEIWVGIKYGDKGIIRFTPDKRKTVYYNHNPNSPSSLSNSETRYMSEAPDGLIYIETANGLNCYSKSKNAFINPLLSSSMNTESLTMAIRSGIHMKQSLLFNKILYLSDEKYEKNLNSFSTSISDLDIISGYKDKNGNIWYGSANKGVYCLIKNSFGFSSFTNKEKTGLNKMVKSISLDEAKNDLWISAYNEIYKYNRATNKTTTFSLKSGNNPFGFPVDENIGAILLSSEKKLYIGCNKRLVIYDTKVKQLEREIHYSSKSNQNQDFLPSSQIKCLFESYDKKIYIGYFGKGISSYNPKTGKLTHYHDKFPALQNNSVFAIREFSPNIFWLGTSKGILKLDLKNNKTTSFVLNPSNLIKSIAFDSKKRIWVGGSGLLFYNEQSETFEYDKIIASKYNVRNILAKNGILWLSTQSGIIRYNPDSASYIIYNKEHGLQGDLFFGSSVFISKNDEFFIGGNNGLSYFFPDSVIKNAPFPKIKMLNCLIANHVTSINEKLNGQAALDESIQTKTELNLNYRNNSFSFEFSAIEYLTPEKIKYKYKLTKFDNDWVEVKKGANYAVYTNIPPGEYTLLITSTNTLGVWNPNPYKLKISIAPPFWQTWWFKALVLLVIVVLLNLFLRWRVHFYRKNQKVLKTMVHERTLELENANTQLKDNQSEILAQNEKLENQRDSLNILNEKLAEQNDELNKHRNQLEILVDNRTRELIEAKIHAEESDKLKSMFLANMSHEIRTPMNAILGFSNLLSTPNLTDEQKAEFIEYINNNGQSLLTLIDDVIDIAKIQTHQLKFTNKSFSINRLLRELYGQYQIVAEKKNISIKLDGANSDLTIKGDYNRIKQVINNLLANAFKFTEKGSVTYGYSIKNNNTLEFFVHDTGIGIADDIIGEIFKKFVKDERSLIKKYRGAGLGLSICKNLVKLMGGKIWVKSQLNKGSSFFFTIKYTKDDSKENESNTKTPENEKIIPLLLIGKRILIVEDEATNLELLKVYLKEAKSEIHTATNGQEAVNIVEANNGNIHLILMDIKMPVMDGIEAYRIISRAYSKIPVIAQTAFAQRHEKNRIIKEGFNDFIAKPIKKELLYKKIENNIL